MLTIGSPQLKLLEKLCNAIGVSGDESEVRKIILEQVKPLADEVKVDAMGNVLVTKKARTKGKALRVMLDAHMDEVGLLLVSNEGDTFSFEVVGGIDSRHLFGKQMMVGKDHTPAVIGAPPPHKASSDDYLRKPSTGSMRVDMGGGSAKVGDRATFAANFKRVGPSIMSKAIDDRIGVATLIELLKHAPGNIELCLSFSVQEEIGLRGTKVAANQFKPDLAIAIDSTPARDLPDHEGRENINYNTKLGLGPAIYTYESRAMHDSRLVKFLQEVAQREKIPYQMRQPGGGGTNGQAIQLSRGGIPTVSVSVPHRYTHSPISIARIDDWKNTLNLVHSVLKRITRDVIKR